MENRIRVLDVLELGNGLLLYYLVENFCVLGLPTEICYVAYVNRATTDFENALFEP